MKILDRLSNLLRSNVNAALDKMTDPAKEIDLLVEQMDDEVRKGRVELRDAIAQEKLRQKKVDEAFRNVQKWQEHAERAVQAGDDELAKEALRRVDQAERQLDDEERTLAQHSHHVQALTERIKQNDRKLAEIRSRKETLKARARAAKQAVSVEGDAFSRFDQLAEQIEFSEHQAEAVAEMARDPELGGHAALVRSTEEKFQRLLPATADEDGAAGGPPRSPRSQEELEMDARLAALKARLDKRGEGA